MVVSETLVKLFSAHRFLELFQFARTWITRLIKILINCKIRLILPAIKTTLFVVFTPPPVQ